MEEKNPVVGCDLTEDKRLQSMGYSPRLKREMGTL